MGSFNVSCGVSNLTIHEGDATGFILLTPNLERNFERDTRFSNSHSMRVYSTDLYLPYLPPVYGVYDDYGNLRDLEESITTKVIERIFRKPALEVINAVGNSRDLYDKHGEICELYLPKQIQDRIGIWQGKEEDEFAALGFTAVDAPEGTLGAYEFEGFRLQKVKAELSGQLAQFERNSWSLVNIETGEELFKNIIDLNGLEPVFSAFAVKTDLMPGFPRDDWDAIRKLLTMSGMFFLKEVHQQLTGPLLEDEFIKEGFDEYEKKFHKIFDKEPKNEDETWRMLYSLGEMARGSGLSTPDEFMYLIFYKGTDEYFELSKFVNNLTAINRLLQPSFNGEQDGNDEASRLLNSITDKILLKRKHRWDEDGDYDEDEPEEEVS